MPMIAYCGLDCGECPARQATLANDDSLREETARAWSAQFNAEISPSDINCSGCTDAEGVKFSHCTECAMRLCALKRPVQTCADCDDYPCEELEQFFGFVPSAKETLDGLRESS